MNLVSISVSIFFVVIGPPSYRGVLFEISLFFQTGLRRRSARRVLVQKGLAFVRNWPHLCVEDRHQFVHLLQFLRCKVAILPTIATFVQLHIVSPEMDKTIFRGFLSVSGEKKCKWVIFAHHCGGKMQLATTGKRGTRGENGNFAVWELQPVNRQYVLYTHVTTNLPLTPILLGQNSASSVPLKSALGKKELPRKNSPIRRGPRPLTGSENDKLKWAGMGQVPASNNERKCLFQALQSSSHNALPPFFRKSPETFCRKL